MKEYWECGDAFGGRMPFSDRGLCDHPACAIAKIEKLEEREGQYQELLMAVQNKIPGESRHETALRIIQESERGAPESCAKLSVHSPTGD